MKLKSGQLKEIATKIRYGKNLPFGGILYDKSRLEEKVKNFEAEVKASYSHLGVFRMNDEWWDGSLYAGFSFNDMNLRRILIGISKIADLACVYPENELDNIKLDALIKTLEKNGFVYVSNELFDQRMDCLNATYTFGDLVFSEA
ncbi:MAG: hypothetical protein AAGK14_12910 [Verrucomicrobiota bacterium]